MDDRDHDNPLIHGNALARHPLIHLPPSLSHPSFHSNSQSLHRLSLEMHCQSQVIRDLLVGFNFTHFQIVLPFARKGRHRTEYDELRRSHCIRKNTNFEINRIVLTNKRNHTALLFF